MGQRNMMCPNQMIDMELDQQAQSNVHPEPCVLFGTSIPNFPQPNVHTMLPAAGNAANFDIHHLPDNHENAVFYGMSQYNGFQHHPSRNLDLGVATASHYFNPYMTPPGTRVFPLSINQGSHIQLPSSSSGIGVPTDDYRRNDHFIDGGFPFKRKNDEGVPPSFQYCNASAGSSSGVAPLNPRPFEPGVTLMDVAPFPLPEYRGNDIPSDCVELGPRYVAPAPPTGLRIHRPHRRALMSDATTRHRDLPHLRVLHTDEVAMLEIPGYHELGHPTDHHRDMRLDIDHMSYEELLALGEQIGHVTTGLSEETILSHLKTRTYMNLEEATCTDEETDFCVVCQTDYKNQEKVGTLDCGHEYHVDCVKRWLLIKNTCPICKAAALSTERKDLRREGR
ncbi:hypothetical protein RHMOL_Rhmol04G0040300 [Rhododendron molle]|uniref:Uncharacterized protein n=1 Tax=Rhododendron molle TaxID=49168 RepID=A0ACC0NYJ1_RHOML|nr:hypothetical protein RHMOL_Rhmol04G0040300 [Rhododendron molle]